MTHVVTSPAWKRLVLLTACYLLFSTGNALAAPTYVTVQSLESVAQYPKLRAPASVLSLAQSRISAEVAARIIEIPVKVGDVVEKDAVLARLESRDYQLALDRARAGAEVLAARRELADYELQRARPLAKKNVVSEQVLKQREADVNILQAEQTNQRIAIRQAERTLSQTVLRAPFKAIITATPGQLGEYATPGTPLLQIADADNLEVSAKVQAHLATALQAAAQLELDTGEARYALQLRTLIPLLDLRAQTREARLTFSGARALSGEAGELVWQDPQAHIPAELLVRRAGKLGVFVADGNQARFIPLDNAQEGRPARTDLGPDTLLILQGRFQLQDGDEITVK